MKMFLRNLWKWLIVVPTCRVCHKFAPVRMMEDGVCLFCVGDRDVAFEEWLNKK